MSSLPAAGIPSLQNDGKTETRISNIFHSPFFKTNLILGLGLLAAVIVIMPFLGKLLGVGLDDRSVGYVLKYGYVFCILIPLRSLEAAFQCLLHVRYHFIFPAVSTIGFNIVIIGILAILFPTLGPPVYVAAVIGGTFIEMLLIGAPAYFMYKKQGTPIAFSDFSNSNYLKLLGMVALIESIGQLVDPFDRFLSGICLLPGYVSATSMPTWLVSCLSDCGGVAKRAIFHRWPN
jgi:peptidoglycan biosynthesis protein MviN/MurJ (putative lipid II flippase)